MADISDPAMLQDIERFSAMWYWGLGQNVTYPLIGAMSIYMEEFFYW